MFALTVFLVGSVGSSLAWNVGSLIAWRVVQGARRRHHVPAADHADHAGRRGQGARPDRHRHRAARPARPDPRPARRRRDPHPPQLAVHVLGQRAVLRRRPVSSPRATCPPTRPDPAKPQAAPRPAGPGPARPRHRRGHPRPEQRGQRGRLRAPRCHRPAGHRRRAPRRLHRLRAALRTDCRSSTSPARPPPGRLGVRGAVLLRLLPLRRDAAAAAVLPGGARRLRADRRAHARPAGRRHAALPQPGRTAHRHDRRPPDRRRRLRHRRRRDRPLRLRRDAAPTPGCSRSGWSSAASASARSPSR